MKAQVVVTPLPLGNKTKATKNENFDQLLLANNKNQIETQWWAKNLDFFEDKYHLVYRSGKTVLQIYYPQGKNMAVNKEINQQVSNQVKKINDQWIKIVDAAKTYNYYRDEQLKELIEQLKKDLNVIIKEQKEVNATDEIKLQEFNEKQEKLMVDFKNHEKVKILDQEWEDYQKLIEVKMQNYLNNQNKNFENFLEEIKFQK